MVVELFSRECLLEFVLLKEPFSKSADSVSVDLNTHELLLATPPMEVFG